MAAGDIIIPNNTITPEVLQKIASEVEKLVSSNAKDPGEWEEVASLQGITSLPVLQQMGTAYKLVRVAVNILQGTNGREVELQVNQENTKIEWRYVGVSGSSIDPTEWRTLIDLALLKGEPGDTAEFRKGISGLEWKYLSEGDNAWRTLVSLSDIAFTFDDFTPEQIQTIWTNIPESAITLFQRPATEAAEKARIAISNTENATKAANNAAKTAIEKAQLAETAASNANTAAGTANTAAGRVDTAIQQATDATRKATEATTQATTATSNANQATEAANTAAGNAMEAATNATTATTNAEVATKRANDAATITEELNANPPKPVAGNWHKYNTETNQYEDTGIQAKGDPGQSFKIVGQYATLEELQAAIPDGSQSEGVYAVGAAYPYHYYAWINVGGVWQWADQGQLQGAEGKSAFEVWMELPGNAEKTEKDYLAYLQQPATDAAKQADAATARADTAASDANKATKAATTAASRANSAAEAANTATTQAQQATSHANTATDNANKATTAANEAAQAANDAAASIFTPDIDHEPGEDDLTYQVGDVSHSYHPGDECRYFDPDLQEYVFYKLHDITSDGKAVWQEAGSGGGVSVLTEKLVLTLTGNQAQPDNALNGLIIHVKYGDNDTSLTWNGAPMTTEIPMNMTYTIEYPVLAGYASPANEEYIALAGNTRQVEASYNTTILMINVSSNQEDKSDLNNVQITLSGSISKILDYNGSPLSVNVPTGKQLVITPSQIEGYAVVQAVTKTPAASSESVSFMYNTTVMRITLTSNQGTDAALNAGTNVTIKCGTVNKTLTWRGSVLEQKIPTGQPYTLTPATLSGYKTPAAKTGTASGANMSESMQYLTELLTVTVNTDNSVSCSGQKVTINGTVHTYNSPISVKIPFGTSYSISVNGKAGFTSPENKSFTANQASRSVTMTYLEIKRGIFILDTDGNLVKRSEWSTSNNSKAVGVAVLSDNCKFVIAPTQNSDKPYWSKYGAHDSVSGVTTTTDFSDANTDYKGVSNSSAIVSKYGASTDYAAGWCQNFSFKNGKKGYLGSCGEWQEAYNNKAEIDACMSLIGGTAIATDDYHWTSTQYDPSSAWLLYWSDGHVSSFRKDTNDRVRAFAAL